VCTAAGSLLVDVVMGSTEPKEGGTVMDDVVALLGLFDINEKIIAEPALFSMFAIHIDIFDQFELKAMCMRPRMTTTSTNPGQDALWDALTPKKGFLACVCIEHCIATNDQAKLEVSLPVMSHLTYHIQSVYNEYQRDLEAVAQERTLCALDTSECPDRDVDERLDNFLLDVEFVIAEMLKLT
jgi:condensin complex subunit 3